MTIALLLIEKRNFIKFVIQQATILHLFEMETEISPNYQFVT